ncbi:uncharacterized oxidoreductase dhs-27-like [Lutzomyia longipalpis]|uniref:uncharacterized oxidoreductase dhs-27-like n=1 Tax=Lutzomyia longipalpis TaxID=7200 RepID=UPI002483BCED|nr:uncharacterized oxidoreductase dhs-27-like [Lutzomyia longipalpis]XP_055692585.1 uncharacterized oxidoreductase dhs-27-like [Lutzomyia longipalpis]XP_055692594.1 uncharacterized oxidoreductase dhs-27-like [Lutzomyia longipalpis]XP_055692603.1 uncharacterized oxidoreductase dhs-27-like [Lutzomyia longipalpis]
MSDTEEDSASSDSWPVNEDWLIDIIKEHHKTASNVKITDFSVKPGSHDGVSNLSDILAVSVDYDIENETEDGARLEIIIKLLPHDPFSRYFVTEAQFDLREIKFYTKILPDLLEFQKNNLSPGETPLRISVPKCLHTHYVAGSFHTTEQHDEENSPEPPESILVLQDMRPFGYKSAHFIKGLTLEEAESAIRAIAAVHALSLGMKTKHKIDLNEKYPFLFQTARATDSYQQLVEQGLPQLTRFLERQPGHQKEMQALTDIRPKTRTLIANLLQPVEPMGLITHTDFWCNNLLFRESIQPESDDNCVVLDWQMVTYSRPTNDIALLLISSLPSKIRREYTSKLLDLYYNTMKINCAKFSIDLEIDLQYDREKLQRDYKKSQLLALLLCVGSVDVAIGNVEAEQRLLDVLQDFFAEGILTSEAEFI